MKRSRDWISVVLTAPAPPVVAEALFYLELIVRIARWYVSLIVHPRQGLPRLASFRLCEIQISLQAN